MPRLAPIALLALAPLTCAATWSGQRSVTGDVDFVAHVIPQSELALTETTLGDQTLATVEYRTRHTGEQTDRWAMRAAYLVAGGGVSFVARAERFEWSGQALAVVELRASEMVALVMKGPL